MKFDWLSNKVIGCAIEVHRQLGPGLLESAYQQCLAHEIAINEIKAVENILGIHQAQLLTYMKLANISVGLLINFNTELLKDGLHRFVL